MPSKDQMSKEAPWKRFIRNEKDKEYRRRKKEKEDKNKTVIVDKDVDDIVDESTDKSKHKMEVKNFYDNMRNFIKNEDPEVVKLLDLLKEHSTSTSNQSTEKMLEEKGIDGKKYRALNRGLHALVKKFLKKENTSSDDVILMLKEAKKLKKVKKDKLPGGKGDSSPDSEFDPKQLQKGIEIEVEHVKDKDLAKEIAKDHLTEIPNYYIMEDGSSRIDVMEEEANKEYEEMIHKKK